VPQHVFDVEQGQNHVFSTQFTLGRGARSKPRAVPDIQVRSMFKKINYITSV